MLSTAIALGGRGGCSVTLFRRPRLRVADAQQVAGLSLPQDGLHMSLPPPGDWDPQKLFLRHQKYSQP